MHTVYSQVWSVHTVVCSKYGSIYSLGNCWYVYSTYYPKAVCCTETMLSSLGTFALPY